MTFINNYGAVLCLTVIFCTVFEMIVPSGNLSKIMYKILGLFAVFTIFFPIFKLFKNINFDFKSISENKNLESSSNFKKDIENQVNYIISENIKKVIEKKLEHIGVKTQKIEVSADKNLENGILDIKCIIYIKKEHSNLKDKLHEEIFKSFKIKPDIIEV